MAGGVPSYVAFLVGAAIAVIGFGPVHRWIISLRRALAELTERPDAKSKDWYGRLVIFVTLHPAPWLFLLGVPFVLYQMAFGKQPGTWVALSVGVIVAVSLMLLMLRRQAAGSSSRSHT